MGFEWGSGRGVITSDGCAVEVWASLPAAGEPELIDHHIPAGASILDLGAGAGRIADPLERLGYRVVAVDDSLDMLARIQLASPVHSRIEELAVAERFDVALLASYLMNNPDVSLRRAFLRAGARHLTSAGVLLAQWHPPEWFDVLVPGKSYVVWRDRVTATMSVDALEADLLTATVDYDLEGERWRHHWQQRRLTVDDLQDDIQLSGLDFDCFVTPDRTWLLAKNRSADSFPE